MTVLKTSSGSAGLADGCNLDEFLQVWAKSFKFIWRSPSLIRNQHLEHLSVEEIYELLRKRRPREWLALPLGDLISSGVTTQLDQSTAEQASADSNMGE